MTKIGITLSIFHFTEAQTTAVLQCVDSPYLAVAADTEESSATVVSLCLDSFECVPCSRVERAPWYILSVCIYM